MAAQDIEERYFPESDARMLLLLEAVLEDGLPQGARDIIPLTSAYPRTLAYLEQKGLPVETRNPAVKRIVLHPYDPSTRKAAFGGSVVLLQTKSTMDYNGGYFDRGLTEESPPAGAGGPDRRAAARAAQFAVCQPPAVYGADRAGGGTGGEDDI